MIIIYDYIRGGEVVNRRIGQFDKATGEVLGDGFVAYVVPKRKNGFQEGWFAMAQSPLELLASADLDGKDYRVLMLLMARLDFENLLVVSQAELARDLNMQRQNVNRAVKRLVALGVLLEGPRIGINRSYRMNPRFGWKGSARNHVVALNEERRRRMEAAGISDIFDGGKRNPVQGES